MLARHLPNLISSIRLVLTPFAVAAVLDGDDRRALWICLLAAITDFLDGFLARRLQIVSGIGRVLDPLADKVMLDVLYGALWLGRGIWAGMLVIVRDLVILAGSAFIHLQTGRRDFPPSFWGKLSTVIQILWLLAYLAHLPGVDWLVYCVVAATVISGIDYIRLGMNMLQQKRRGGN